MPLTAFSAVRDETDPYKINLAWAFDGAVSYFVIDGVEFDSSQRNANVFLNIWLSRNITIDAYLFNEINGEYELNSSMTASIAQGVTPALSSPSVISADRTASRIKIVFTVPDYVETFPLPEIMS